jgi:hypothetical protein
MNHLSIMRYNQRSFNIAKKCIFGLAILIYQMDAVAIDPGMVYIELDNQTNYHVNIQYGNNERFFNPIIKVDGIDRKTKKIMSAMENMNNNGKRVLIEHYDHDPEGRSHFIRRGACELLHTDTPETNKYTIYKVNIAEKPGNERCWKTCIERVCKLVSVTKHDPVPYVIFKNGSSKNIDAEIFRWYWGSRQTIAKLKISPNNNAVHPSQLPSDCWGGWCSKVFISLKTNGQIFEREITGEAHDVAKYRQIIYALNNNQVNFDTKARNQFEH